MGRLMHMLISADHDHYIASIAYSSYVAVILGAHTSSITVRYYYIIDLLLFSNNWF